MDCRTFENKHYDFTNAPEEQVENVPSSKGDTQGNPSTSFDFSFSAVTLVKRTVEEPYFVVPSMMASRHQSCRKQEYHGCFMFENKVNSKQG